MSFSQIEQLRSEITMLNESYRDGVSLVPDSEYDAKLELLASLSPTDPLLKKTGIAIDDSDPRKRPHFTIMASQDKLKSLEEGYKWLKSYFIPQDTLMVVMPKLDGMAMDVNEDTNEVVTGGDQHYGREANEHYKLIACQKYAGMESNPFTGMISCGEIIMRDQVFNDKWEKEDYSNPRSLVSGTINADYLSRRLEDMEYIRFNLISNNPAVKFATKSGMLSYLNAHQHYQLPFVTLPASELTADYLKELYFSWNKEFTLDGLIIEVDNLNLQKTLGRETNTLNPAYSRAYKADFEEVKETTITGREYAVSKFGVITPVSFIEPTMLDKALVKRATNHNAAMMVNSKLGIGAKILIKRSGSVIPFIYKVLEEVEVDDLPTCCPVCKSEELDWTLSSQGKRVQLICTNLACEAQALKRMIAFFSILKVDGVSEGICTGLYESGFDSIEKVLKMSEPDFLTLDRFGERKAKKVYAAIHSKLKDVPLSKLQHASGLFKGLGSTKLLLLEHFDSKPTVEEIVAIDGFAPISASFYLSAYDAFFSFISNLPVSFIKTPKKEADSDELKGISFCFSQIRRKDLEEIILTKGGTVAKGVSKKLSYLVVADKTHITSKVSDALKNGVTILDEREAERLIMGLHVTV